MAQLKGTKTHDNLKAAFAGESQANRRYLYFARHADIEGYPDVGGLFRDTAEAETGHAHGHLDYLKAAGDPATDKPIGPTDSGQFPSDRCRSTRSSARRAAVWRARSDSVSAIRRNVRSEVSDTRAPPTAPRVPRA